MPPIVAHVQIGHAREVPGIDLLRIDCAFRLHVGCHQITDFVGGLPDALPLLGHC